MKICFISGIGASIRLQKASSPKLGKFMFSCNRTGDTQLPLPIHSTPVTGLEAPSYLCPTYSSSLIHSTPVKGLDAPSYLCPTYRTARIHSAQSTIFYLRPLTCLCIFVCASKSASVFIRRSCHNGALVFVVWFRYLIETSHYRPFQRSTNGAEYNALYRQQNIKE